MQVRRRTPILEARKFTNENALDLIDEGWLSEIQRVDGVPVGLVTKAAGRDRHVPMGGYIVWEETREAVVQPPEGAPADEAPTTVKVRVFRPYAPDDFAASFDVTGEEDIRTWEGEGSEAAEPESAGEQVPDPEGSRAEAGNTDDEPINSRQMSQAEIDEAALDGAEAESPARGRGKR